MNLSIKKFFGNDYSLSVFVKLFSFAIGLLSSIFSTRYLGVINKGSYANINQIANILVIICNLGIYQSYSYNYKKHIENIQKKYSDICFLQLLILMIFVIIISTCSNSIEITLAMVLVPFNVIRQQYENIMLIENIRFRFRIQMLNSVLIMLTYAILFWGFDSSVIAVVGVTVAVDIITVTIYLIKLKIVPQFWKVDLKFLITVLKFGFLPMFSALLLTINYSIDILFLRNMGTDVELGLYSLAVNIISYVWMIPDAFKDVLFSRSAKSLDRKNISFSMQISFAFILMCFFGFIVLGKFLITLMYGKEFVDAYAVIVLLIVGALSMSIYKIIGIILVSQGKRVVNFVSLAISASVNVVLNYLMIPKIGMMGAAIASIASYTICAIILLFYFRREFSFTFKELFIPSKYTIVMIKEKIHKKNHCK